MIQNPKDIYKNLKTKKEYIDFYKDPHVARKYSRSDLTGLSPLITEAETNAIISVSKKFLNLKNSSLLDLATGSGRIIKVLENFFKSSVGIDSSQLMLKKARERTKKSTFKLSDSEKLPFKNNNFEVITCFRFLINIPKKNRLKMLKEAKRVLKKNGLLIINIHHNKLNPKGFLEILMGDRHSQRSISYFEIKSELALCGLKIINTRGMNIPTLAKLLPFLSKRPLLKIDKFLGNLPIAKIISESLIIFSKNE